jgi:hypothetical protein
VVGLSIGVNSALIVVGLVLETVARGGPWVEGAALGLIGAGLSSMYLVPKIRRRSLTVSDTGLTAQRDTYRVSCLWDDVADVRRRRLGGIVVVDEIVFQRGRTEPVDSRGKTRRGVSPKVAKSGADRRIQIGVYDAAWRDGPVGEILAARGLTIGRP